jgi:hypothetical protein
MQQDQAVTQVLDVTHTKLRDFLKTQAAIGSQERAEVPGRHSARAEGCPRVIHEGVVPCHFADVKMALISEDRKASRAALAAWRPFAPLVFFCMPLVGCGRLAQPAFSRTQVHRPCSALVFLLIVLAERRLTFAGRAREMRTASLALTRVLPRGSLGSA